MFPTRRRRPLPRPQTTWAGRRFDGRGHRPSGAFWRGWAVWKGCSQLPDPVPATALHPSSGKLLLSWTRLHCSVKSPRYSWVCLWGMASSLVVSYLSLRPRLLPGVLQLWAPSSREQATRHCPPGGCAGSRPGPHRQPGRWRPSPPGPRRAWDCTELAGDVL